MYLIRLKLELMKIFNYFWTYAIANQERLILWNVVKIMVWVMAHCMWKKYRNVTLWHETKQCGEFANVQIYESDWSWIEVRESDEFLPIFFLLNKGAVGLKFWKLKTTIPLSHNRTRTKLTKVIFRMGLMIYYRRTFCGKSPSFRVHWQLIEQII